MLGKPVLRTTADLTPNLTHPALSSGQASASLFFSVHPQSTDCPWLTAFHSSPGSRGKVPSPQPGLGAFLLLAACSEGRRDCSTCPHPEIGQVPCMGPLHRPASHSLSPRYPPSRHGTPPAGGQIMCPAAAQLSELQRHTLECSPQPSLGPQHLAQPGFPHLRAR